MANGNLWTDAEDRIVVETYQRYSGRNGWAIEAARQLSGRSSGTVAKRKAWLVDHGRLTDLSGEPTVGDVWQAMHAEQETHALDWMEKFRPVELPPLERPRVKAKPSNAWIVTSDHHWPCHDDRCEAIVLQAIEAVKPVGYILDGDGPDMLALSAYPKDARRGHSWELRDEQRAAKSWWRSVGSLMQQWGGLLYETEANHSGDGTASRWRRWLNLNASTLFQLDGIEEALSYPNYFHHPDVPVAMTEEVIIAGDLRVRHGEMVRKHGAYSARAHGDKWQSSVMHGHTHRIGSSIKRRPGIPGVRPDEWLRTFEIGCMCRMDLDYCPGADWANGFAIVHVDPSEPNGYATELVQIINGRATSTTLGGTLAA